MLGADGPLCQLLLFGRRSQLSQNVSRPLKMSLSTLDKIDRTILRQSFRSASQKRDHVFLDKSDRANSRQSFRSASQKEIPLLFYTCRMARAFAMHDTRGLDVHDEGYDDLLEVEDLRSLPGAIEIIAEDTAAEEAPPLVKPASRAGTLMLNRQPGSRATTPKPTRPPSASVGHARKVACFILDPFPVVLSFPSFRGQALSNARTPKG